ncbi:uncharacterized protein V6R79_008961, partial [Siganus canaliculatus]
MRSEGSYAFSPCGCSPLQLSLAASFCSVPCSEIVLQNLADFYPRRRRRLDRLTALMLHEKQ